MTRPIALKRDPRASLEAKAVRASIKAKEKKVSERVRDLFFLGKELSRGVVVDLAALKTNDAKQHVLDFLARGRARRHLLDHQQKEARALPPTIGQSLFPGAAAGKVFFPERTMLTLAQLNPLFQANPGPAQLTTLRAQTLATATGQLGLLGIYQAVRAAKLAASLQGNDAAAFGALLQRAEAKNDLVMVVYLYKALAAGHSVGEISQFAQEVEAAFNSYPGNAQERALTLQGRLNLADPLGDADLQQDGIKQQFSDSCVPTTGQALRGELDPISAWNFRKGTIHEADDSNPMAYNQEMATEQLQNLFMGGGKPAPRTAHSRGAGVRMDYLDSFYSGLARPMGLAYRNVFLQPAQFNNPLFMANVLDAVATQLTAGIPVPLTVTNTQGLGGHEVLALDVYGTGPDRELVIHDPYTGETRGVKLTALASGNFDFIGWNRILGVGEAHELPAPTVSLPGIPGPLR